MVVNARPVVFDDNDPRPMFDHLAGWARHALTSSDEWARAVEATGWWTDLSPRNQVLLASYPTVAGPVAGAATWATVASVDPDRQCVPRAGEHGYPLRVPVTTTRSGPVSDRSRHGFTTAGSLDSLRWEPVFTAAQLAPRPHPAALRPPGLPDSVATAQGFAEAVRRTVLRVEGRTPNTLTAPIRRLEIAARRIPATGSGPVLNPELWRQAAWVVADRVGHAAGPFPAFDPSRLSPRDRWQMLVEARAVTMKLLTAMGHAVGADLTCSPLPKVVVVQDREVRPGRRNLLSPAERANLPAGQWTEIGPYKPGDWAQRGIENADGRGAFYGLAGDRYLAVYETTDGARWRLESVSGRVRTGIVDEGHGGSFDLARRYGLDHVRRTRPALVRTVAPSSKLTVLTPTAVWQPLPGARDDRTSARALDHEVRLVVSPGPGGRWQAWLQNGTELAAVTLSRSMDGAKGAAEHAGWRARLDNASRHLPTINGVLLDAVATGAWSRDLLAAAIGDRVEPAERATLTDPTVDARGLAGVLADAGLPADTIVAITAAEQFDARDVATVAVEFGAHPIPTIELLRDRYDIAVIDAGGWIGASTGDLRAVGATAVELLQVAPREVLRELDQRPETWQTAAGMMIGAGFDPTTTAVHLARMAPTAEALAAGLGEIFDSYQEAIVEIGARLDDRERAALADIYQQEPTVMTALRIVGFDDHDGAGPHPPTVIDRSDATATDLTLLEQTVLGLVAELPEPATTSGDTPDRSRAATRPAAVAGHAPIGVVDADAGPELVDLPGPAEW